MPLHALLGDAGRASVPAYASLLRYGKPDDVARNVTEALARGYRHIKLHEFDLRCIRAAHLAAPATPLMLDINCVWDTEAEAAQFCEDVAGLNVAWVEEPIWPPEDIPAIARIRAASPVPIAAGECNGTVEDFCRMFELRAVDVAQPSITKIGGVSAMLEIAELAREAGVRLVPHCPYFGPGLLATLHFLAATRGGRADRDLLRRPGARALSGADPARWRHRGAERAGAGLRAGPLAVLPVRLALLGEGLRALDEVLAVAPCRAIAG